MNTDTITAISTPLGEGGIGIVRISGKKTLKIADHIFKGKLKPSQAKTHTIHYGKIIDPSDKKEIDEVLLMLMRKPHTYTCEDMVEINTHGGVMVLKKILELVTQNGARLAEPGEFTKRAFLSGRIDLAQAEAVLDIVKAKTDKSLSLALSQLDGKLSAKIKALKSRLIKTLTKLELSIDFPEENIEELDKIEIKKITHKVNYEISNLLKSGESGKIIREGASFPIVGRTNVGKSSLFNALLSENKAIVTKYPGTTRDVIEGWLSIDGIPVKLVDTAGVKDTDNPIEKESILKTRKAIKEAFGILFVVDKSVGILKEDIELINYVKDSAGVHPPHKGKKIIGLLNKCDLPPAPPEANVPLAQKADWNKVVAEPFKVRSLISVSALRGDNINLILSLIAKSVSSNNRPPLITRERHLNALRRAKICTERAEKEIKNLTPELIAYEIKSALNTLGEITGEVTSEDILDRIFSQFCIGK
ncbi:tRNA uridine-5-carboxymethylaminomethyl(34) synthesis GTPase MnmE [candidate division WOR-3 bacterium]|nr:tRNA uridine-5-carboxymethylaminomethyl(34) synthesis GTPase MnmE [candidate division WOR-3 bacterium]